MIYIKRIGRDVTGSLTVEAALITPLVLMCIMFLIYVIEIYGVQSDMHNALFMASEKISIDIQNGTNYNITYVEGCVNECLPDDVKNNKSILGGIDGISYNKSKINSNGEYEICAEYKYKIPGIFWNTNGINLCQKIQSRAFVGNVDEEDNNVYITPSGKVYHLFRDCTYLQIIVFEAKSQFISNYRNVSGGKYYKCSVCNNEHYDGEHVYITTYGTSYHVSKSCSTLRRDVEAVDISEVGGRTKCNKCALRE